MKKEDTPSRIIQRRYEAKRKRIFIEKRKALCEARRIEKRLQDKRKKKIVLSMFQDD